MKKDLTNLFVFGLIKFANSYADPLHSEKPKAKLFKKKTRRSSIPKEKILINDHEIRFIINPNDQSIELWIMCSGKIIKSFNIDNTNPKYFELTVALRKLEAQEVEFLSMDNVSSDFLIRNVRLANIAEYFKSLNDKYLIRPIKQNDGVLYGFSDAKQTFSCTLREQDENIILSTEDKHYTMPLDLQHSIINARHYVRTDHILIEPNIIAYGEFKRIIDTAIGSGHHSWESNLEMNKAIGTKPLSRMDLFLYQGPDPRGEIRPIKYKDLPYLGRDLYDFQLVH